MHEKLNEATDDLHLKAVVNSVFDAIDVVHTIAELKALNEGCSPRWYANVE